MMWHQVPWMTSSADNIDGLFAYSICAFRCVSRIFKWLLQRFCQTATVERAESGKTGGAARQDGQRRAPVSPMASWTPGTGYILNDALDAWQGMHSEWPLHVDAQLTQDVCTYMRRCRLMHASIYCCFCKCSRHSNSGKPKCKVFEW